MPQDAGEDFISEVFRLAGKVSEGGRPGADAVEKSVHLIGNAGMGLRQRTNEVAENLGRVRARLLASDSFRAGDADLFAVYDALATVVREAEACAQDAEHLAEAVVQVGRSVLDAGEALAADAGRQRRHSDGVGDAPDAAAPEGEEEAYLPVLAREARERAVAILGCDCDVFTPADVVAVEDPDLAMY
jgi:hypothetical protein